MKRKFNVTVDGKTYTVEVEEVHEKGEVPSQVSPPKARLSVRKRTVSPRAPVGDGVIIAPLPGVVSDLRVSEGDSVDAGAVLLVLEAQAGVEGLEDVVAREKRGSGLQGSRCEASGELQEGPDRIEDPGIHSWNALELGIAEAVELLEGKA